jgi:hypothetical protein
MSRQTYLLGLGLALVAGAFVVTDAALGPRPGVTEANARRVRPGMMLAELEELFGEPPVATGQRGYYWFRDRVEIWVETDADRRRVLAAHVQRLPDPRQATGDNSALITRLRAWLGW